MHARPLAMPLRLGQCSAAAPLGGSPTSRLRPQLLLRLLLTVHLLQPSRLVTAQAQPGPPGSPSRPWSFSGLSSKSQAVAQAQADPLLTRLVGRTGSLSSDPSLDSDMQQQFQQWAHYFDYHFAPGPERNRSYTNFVNTVQSLQRGNVDASVPFWCGANQFAHLSRDDYKAAVLMANVLDNSGSGGGAGGGQGGALGRRLATSSPQHLLL